MAIKKNTQKIPKKFGRPSNYTPELGKEICDEIASSELGLRQLLELNPHWPDRRNIFKWILRYEDFRLQYYKAKEQQTECVVEYMQELMSEEHYYTEKDTGQVRVDVPLLRLKIDTMKWHAGKLKPKKWADNKQPEPENDNSMSDDCKRRMKEQDEKNKKEY